MHPFIYIFLLLLIITIVKTAWFKGIIGEFIVNVSAKLLLDKEKYHLIKNVTLPTENGTTQIDHIIVSKYGIFVVETKNMKGWIFGNEKQRTWTQKIFKHSNKFQNPLYQNYKHTQTLQSLLGLTDREVYSLIVFVGDSTFKTDMPPNVTEGGGYIRYIKSKTREVLSPAETREIIRKIESGRLKPSIKTNKEHINHLKNKSYDPSCPKCGNKMILREAKIGANKGNKFWGCSMYPKCKGIRKRGGTGYLKSTLLSLCPVVLIHSLRVH